MVSVCKSMGILGMECYGVEVEADLSSGIPAFEIVGLPDTAVKESRERVRASMRNCGFDFPVSRLTLNLAPADIKKEGPIYDLPILIAILRVNGQIKQDLSDCAFVGELSLSGELRSVNGVLPMTIKAKELGIKRLFVPACNAGEGSVIDGIDVYPVKDLFSLYAFLCGRAELKPVKPDPYSYGEEDSSLDFSQVMGQESVKRALEVAAAGGHNVLLIGPPGSGKSMLAKRLPSILPEMSFEESIETTKIYSAAGELKKSRLIRTRPFCSPHHTVSAVGMSGGGAVPRPGVVSLAHNGVLFMDELAEFTHQTMEILRQPLEDGTISISRAAGTFTYPCSFMLVAAMNPCPCGYHNDEVHTCSCSPNDIKRYLNRISGPLLDRIDIIAEVSAVQYSDLALRKPAEPSKDIRSRVNAARAIQKRRYSGKGIHCNAQITAEIFRDVCKTDGGASAMLEKNFDRLGLSARAYDRILKVARTVADLDASEVIQSRHILEAIRYRNAEKRYWNR